MAQDPVESAAWRLIEATPGWPRVRVLELGCGDGALLERVVAAGAEAWGTTFRDAGSDYIRERGYPDSIRERIIPGVDLNRPLPPSIEPGSFDLVFSTEVIEHVESHINFIASAAGALRAGGRLVLTTPNLHRLSNRLRFGLTGVHGYKRRMLPATAGPGRIEEFHHRCVDLAVLHPIMWMHGLRIDSMEVSSRKGIDAALRFVAPPFGFITRRIVCRKAGAGEELESKLDLARWLNSVAARTSEQLCIGATKTGATPASRQEHAA